MIFAIHRLFGPGAAEGRVAIRPAHADYIKSLGHGLVLAGSFLGPDGTTPTGNFLLVEAADLDSAETIAAEDPYTKAGLFASVTVQPYRIAHLHPPE